jgi:hypothetical protein
VIGDDNSLGKYDCVNDWLLLQGHGYLLGAPMRLQILMPHDERALSFGLESDNEGTANLAHAPHLAQFSRSLSLASSSVRLAITPGIVHQQLPHRRS